MEPVVLFLKRSRLLFMIEISIHIHPLAFIPSTVADFIGSLLLHACFLLFQVIIQFPVVDFVFHLHIVAVVLRSEILDIRITQSNVSLRGIGL